MSILKVNATGKIEKKPDEMILTFRFSKTLKAYDEVVKEGTKIVNKFITFLNSKEIDKSKYNTSGFNVREEYKYVERVGTNKRVLDGYTYSQVLEVKMDIDLNFLKTLMNEVSSMNDYPNLNVRFGLKNYEEAKKEALKEAFITCKEKANILAEISNKEIEDCIEINYGVKEDYVIGANAVNCEMAMFSKNSSRSMKENSIDYENIINPDDITITESIITIWKLK